VKIAMTSLQRRICKLEAPLAVSEIVVPDWAVAMRERQRRRAEAEGRPYVERAPLVLEQGKSNDWAAIMRACRNRRAAEAQRAEAQQ
jgi:hypothetical protein